MYILSFNDEVIKCIRHQSYSVNKKLTQTECLTLISDQPVIMNSEVVTELLILLLHLSLKNIEQIKYFDVKNVLIEHLKQSTAALYYLLLL